MSVQSSIQLLVLKATLPRPAGSSRSAYRTASLRLCSRVLGRGLSDDELVAGIQFSAGHGRKRKVSHAEPHLDRFESFVGIQLPDNAAVFAQAIRCSGAATILAAVCATRIAALLCFSSPASLTLATTRASTIVSAVLNPSCCYRAARARRRTNTSRRSRARTFLDSIFCIQRLAFAVGQIRFKS